MRCAHSSTAVVRYQVACCCDTSTTYWRTVRTVTLLQNSSTTVAYVQQYPPAFLYSHVVMSAIIATVDIAIFWRTQAYPLLLNPTKRAPRSCTRRAFFNGQEQKRALSTSGMEGPTNIKQSALVLAPSSNEERVVPSTGEDIRDGQRHDDGGKEASTASLKGQDRDTSLKTPMAALKELTPISSMPSPSESAVCNRLAKQNYSRLGRNNIFEVRPAVRNTFKS